MAKYCGKCGSKLDEATGLCPNCDADKLTKQTERDEPTKIPFPEQTEAPDEKPLSKREAKKALKKQKRESMTTGQKARRVCLKVLLCLIAVAVLIGGSIVTLVYYDVLDIPAIKDYLVDTDIKANSELATTQIGESYVPNSENVVYFDQPFRRASSI